MYFYLVSKADRYDEGEVWFLRVKTYIETNDRYCIYIMDITTLDLMYCLLDEINLSYVLWSGLYL
jgi:hypothetical protein